MKNIDSKNHVTGKSVYVDDIPVQTGTLHGAVFGSPKAHGKIINIDLSKAEAVMEQNLLVLTADCQISNLYL